MAEPTAPLELAAAGARDELLATKVNIPRTRPDRLARSRVLERLDEGMGRALVLVCTPAGFGKTALLADWAADATLPVAWLSLDPDDNDRCGSGAMWSRPSIAWWEASASTLSRCSAPAAASRPMV